MLGDDFLYAFGTKNGSLVASSPIIMTTLPLLFRSLAIASPWSLPDTISSEPT